MFILNAFSLNMIEGNVDLVIQEITKDVAQRLASGAVSAVGHADTAAVFSAVLGVEIPANRATVALKEGDVALVGQYVGPRLPEGATTLPEGAQIKWVVVGVRRPRRLWTFEGKGNV